MKSAVFASVTFLAATTGAFAQVTLASDTFELADHPGGDRLTIGLTGGTFPWYTGGIPFYTRNATGVGYSVSIANDAIFGSNTLRLVDTTTGAGGNQIIGVLPLAIVLANDNDFITLSFKFRYLNLATVTANPAGFRFGIWGDAGTVVTGDNQATVSDNDQGYYVQTGVGAAAAPGAGNLFYNEGGGIVPIGGGTDRSPVTANAAGLVINDELVHTGLLTIRRSSATTIALTATYDGTTTFTGTSSGTIRTSFSEISFNDGFVTSPVQFAVDDVVVTTNVPEPATGLMCAFGLVALATGRRRTRN